MSHRFSLRTVSIAAALVTAIAWTGPPRASAENADAAALREAVESLDRAGCLVVAGVTVRASPIVTELYRRRAFAPVWSDSSSVDELSAAIEDAARQGLDPADYHAPAIAKLRDRTGSVLPWRSADPRATAERDLILTEALVRVARDVRFGRVPPVRPDPLALDGPDAAAELQGAIDGGRIAAQIDSLEPATGYYSRLQRALAEYRRLAESGGWPAVPAGPSLKPDASDPRVGVLRERLAITGDIVPGAGGAAGIYDAELVEGVRAFQARHGLESDGVLGRGTLAALNVPVGQRIDQIRATLERSRWYLHDLPDRFVMVNAAGYRVVLFDQGQAVWRARAIVGKPLTSTPMFRAAIDAVILNPTWTIPASIVRNEILPKLHRDPRYLAKERISRFGDDYVQAAGKDNALGRLKLSMPNSHSVYLHDTPSRSLFGRASRTFSHGCVRVERPVELAALVLNDPEWTVEALEAGIATGKTRRIPLRTPAPVLVYYWSVTMSDEGVVEFLPDVYGRDEEVFRALRASAISRTCR